MMRAHIMTFETLLNDEENQVMIVNKKLFLKVTGCLSVCVEEDLQTTEPICFFCYSEAIHWSRGVLQLF